MVESTALAAAGTSGTVFVVDDDLAVRKSLNMLFASVGMNVRAFGSGQEFLDQHDAAEPGCLVLDIRMPGLSGLDLQRRLKENGNRIPIVVITGHGDVPIAVRALKDGAVEFLEKPFSKQVLLEHVRSALRLDAERRRDGERQAEVQDRLAVLTAREREVMEHVVAGRASKQIAIDLGISKKTVDVHRARVMQKLQVESVPELVQLALTPRLTHPGS